MNLQCIRPVFGCQSDLLKLTRLRIVSDANPETHGLEIVAQHILFLGRGTFMHAEQADMLAVGNKVSRAHIGSQHGFFNQAVSHIAGTRHDFLDSPGIISNDLSFSRFKINCTTHTTLLKERLINIM